MASIHFNLADEKDRQLYITWMKQIKAANPESQLDIDRCVIAVGGTPEVNFPNYELFQQ